MVFSLNEIGMRSVALDDTYPYDWIRRMIADYRRIRPCWYGDFYPLTTCSMTPDAWSAYQLHRTDLDEGAIVVFRRPENIRWIHPHGGQIGTVGWITVRIPDDDLHSAKS
jgi:hypothetical protein